MMAREVFNSRMATLQAHEELREKIRVASDLSRTGIFDSDGMLVNTSESWPPPNIQIADRAYFQALKASATTNSVIVELIRSRLTGEWTVVTARRIVGPNGEFFGVVTRGIAATDFERFFASVALGQDAAISMHHRDGVLMARYPHVTPMIGRNFKSGSANQRRLFDANETARLASPVDGQSRITASYALTELPITIVAATSETAALTDWRKQTKFLVVTASASALIIAIILYLIVRQLLREHQKSRRQLTLDKQRLNTAINNMTQGLLLFDASEHIVVCNRRYIEMYGLSAEIVKPGCSLRAAIAHRKATGSVAGDVDEYCSAVLHNVAQRNLVVANTADGRSIQIANEPVPGGGWVETHEDITERKLSEQRIAHLAHYDALTGLPNRLLFRKHLELELKRAARGEQFALLYIDIDEFKSINDSLGHPVGDELLKVVAERLKNCVRETEFVAHLGGDEFAIVQTAVGSSADVTDLVARIFNEIRRPCSCLSHELSTDASIGIAIAPQDGIDMDQLIKNADLAMYGAKADGRRTFRFFEPSMDAIAKARRTLELDLRQAMADDNFEIYYQPVVDLQTNEITGCEALLRWRHPLRGMISPAEFIPVAEDTGLINQLGEWVLSKACAEAATWPNNISLAVNVSPVQFKGQTFALRVAAALASSNLPARRLELEITEAVLIRDDEAALAVLHQLRALGVRIALDDFGTGYSSLSYLQRFPFDKIKIDRSFVNDIAMFEPSAAIVQAVVKIAAVSNMTTTAEGVETETQRELLRAFGCNQMQGYLFSPAIPAVDLRRLFLTSSDRAAAVA
jgi:diguanylate cyclase (GGDEF)-like protein/PAS domain S-box-containing protein